MNTALRIANLSLLILFPISWFAPLLRAALLPIFGLDEISVISFSSPQSFRSWDILENLPWPIFSSSRYMSWWLKVPVASLSKAVGACICSRPACLFQFSYLSLRRGPLKKPNPRSTHSTPEKLAITGWSKSPIESLLRRRSKKTKTRTWQKIQPLHVPNATHLPLNGQVAAIPAANGTVLKRLSPSRRGPRLRTP